MTQEGRMEYALANRRAQFRIAAENPAKMDRLQQLLEQHEEGRVLTIGEYIVQVEAIAEEIGAPLVTGKTPQTEREQIYDSFRRGELRCIVLSNVGNFAIDLPDADVLIQASGMFGSRQDEAQRLDRILRPPRRMGEPSIYSPWFRTTPARRSSPTTASSSLPSRGIPTKSSSPTRRDHRILRVIGKHSFVVAHHQDQGRRQPSPGSRHQRPPA